MDRSNRNAGYNDSENDISSLNKSGKCVKRKAARRENRNWWFWSDSHWFSIEFYLSLSVLQSIFDEDSRVFFFIFQDHIIQWKRESEFKVGNGGGSWRHRCRCCRRHCRHRRGCYCWCHRLKQSDMSTDLLKSETGEMISWKMKGKY